MRMASEGFELISCPSLQQATGESLPVTQRPHRDGRSQVSEDCGESGPVELEPLLAGFSFLLQICRGECMVQGSEAPKCQSKFPHSGSMQCPAEDLLCARCCSASMTSTQSHRSNTVLLALPPVGATTLVHCCEQVANLIHFDFISFSFPLLLHLGLLINCIIGGKAGCQWGGVGHRRKMQVPS